MYRSSVNLANSLVAIAADKTTHHAAPHTAIEHLALTEPPAALHGSADRLTHSLETELLCDARLSEVRRRHFEIGLVTMR